MSICTTDESKTLGHNEGAYFAKKVVRYLLIINMEIQTRIPVALAAIHNYILSHDPDKGQLPGEQLADRLESGGGLLVYNPEDRELEGAEQSAEQIADVPMNNLHNQIATDMWKDYQCVLAERGPPEDRDATTDNDAEDDSDMAVDVDV